MLFESFPKKQDQQAPLVRHPSCSKAPSISMEGLFFLSQDGGCWHLDLTTFEFRLVCQLSVFDGFYAPLTVSQPVPNGALLQNATGWHSTFLATREVVCSTGKVHNPTFRGLKFRHQGQVCSVSVNKKRQLVLKNIKGRTVPGNAKKCVAAARISDMFYCAGRLFVLQVDSTMFSIDLDTTGARREEDACRYRFDDMACSCWSQDRFYKVSNAGAGAMFDCTTRTWSPLPSLTVDPLECVAVFGDRLFVKKVRTLEECVDGRWVERQVLNFPNVPLTVGFAI